jgi:hypothetical protein
VLQGQGNLRGICLVDLDTQYARGESEARGFGRGYFTSLRGIYIRQRSNAAGHMRQESNLLKVYPHRASVRRRDYSAVRMSEVLLPALIIRWRVAGHVRVSAAGSRMTHRRSSGRQSAINLAREYPRARHRKRNHQQYHRAEFSRALHVLFPAVRAFPHAHPIGFLILRPGCVKMKRETEAPPVFARASRRGYNASGWPAGRVMARGLFEPM